MFVDRFRFAGDPDRLNEGEQPVVSRLFKNRVQFGGARALLSDWRAVIAGCNAFEDHKSRALFFSLLVYRYLAPHISAVANNRPMADALNKFMQTDYPSGAPLQLPTLLNEPIVRWRVTYNGAPFEIATTKYGLYWTLVSTQYYFRRGDIYVGPEAGDNVLDCGGFLGDTAVKLAAHVGETGKVFSFDPFPAHVSVARDIVSRNGLADRVQVYCCGVSDQTKPGADIALSQEKLPESDAISPGRPLAMSDANISIDDFCRTLNISKIDYIKMDIEGSEALALDGAQSTIEKHKPKLAICLYHKPSDLWTLPIAIKRRYPFYRLYLDHHSLHSEETVMYAIASRTS